MKSTKVTDNFSISGQLEADDIPVLAEQGVEILICNRPDKEAEDQPPFADLAAKASEYGIETHMLPFVSGALSDDITKQFSAHLDPNRKMHAFCRTGNRSFNVYCAALASQGADYDDLTALAKQVGIDVSAAIKPYYPEKTMSDKQASSNPAGAKPAYDVVIVGAGSGGIAVASSLRKRNSRLRIVLIDAATNHYYQPGWTMVGGGVFDARTTRRDTSSLIPSGVTWIRQAVTGFNPDANEVQLDNGDIVHYEQLIVSPGLKLNWGAIEGLEATLGKNGVTSNYRYDLAPYTWELVKGLKKGTALFTQPPMPIKCAGAPQKAMYLSCDHWLKSGNLNAIDVHFLNAGGVLFGVADYVPALQSYIEKYGVQTHYTHNLTSVDGDNRTATFQSGSGEDAKAVTMEFDMMHVCPPQCAPDFVASSSLADAAGWLDVNQFSLQHKKYPNIWGLGDVMNAPNAKTMAAVRKQVPVVADNLVAVMNGKNPVSGYDGYGSCPLTVENGKIVLAEFGYGGKLLPSFPQWVIKGTKPTRAAWILKKDILPGVYWQAMLKGREWLAGPSPLEEVQS